MSIIFIEPLFRNEKNLLLLALRIDINKIQHLTDAINSIDVKLAINRLNTL